MVWNKQIAEQQNFCLKSYLLFLFIDYSDAKGPFDWSPMHVQNVIRLKQEALNAARKAWADFVLVSFERYFNVYCSYFLRMAYQKTS